MEYMKEKELLMMGTNIIKPTILGLLLLTLSGNAASTLIDRGAGMVYDSEQDLTWLIDANFANTSNDSAYSKDVYGRMSWGTALSWAEDLVYSGYDDWRLPQIKGDTTCDYFSQEKNCGYNVDPDSSELAYMFHAILGNGSKYNPDGSRNYSDCPDEQPHCLQNDSADGITIDNIQSYLNPDDFSFTFSTYWTGTTHQDDEGGAFYFSPALGLQSYYNKADYGHAWAVRSGDVGNSIEVPEPETLLLFAGGFLGIAISKKTRKRKST
jgi:hypothetical protein